MLNGATKFKKNMKKISEYLLFTKKKRAIQISNLNSFVYFCCAYMVIFYKLEQLC